MHPSWNRAKVQSHFGSCGNISKLWNIRDAAYNNTENFIIYFDEEQAAKECVAQFNDKELDGVKVSLKITEEQPAKVMLDNNSRVMIGNISYKAERSDIEDAVRSVCPFLKVVVKYSED